MQPGDELADYLITTAVPGAGPAEVYLARPPTRLGLEVECVAVKVIPGGDEQAFRRFTRELKLYARVQDPGLLNVYDAGQHHHQFFTTTEWCAAGSLEAAEEMTRGDRLTSLARAARAVHALHEAGIVHRDIRPATIVRRADGSAVLADLGTAHVGTATMTSMAPTAAIGYTDPLLLLGDPPSRATDIYALGATLHRVLTGRHLHPQLEGGDLLLGLRTVLNRAPRIERSSLTTDEADLVAACVDRQVEARPPTAEAFAVLVEELIGGGA